MADNSNEKSDDTEEGAAHSAQYWFFAFQSVTHHTINKQIGNQC